MDSNRVTLAVVRIVHVWRVQGLGAVRDAHGMRGGAVHPQPVRAAAAARPVRRGRDALLL